IHEAKINNLESVTVWGDGTPLREFLHVDDLASACVYIMQNCSSEQIGEFVNIGTGIELTISQLTNLLCKLIGYQGEIVFDETKPNGTPRKLTNVSKLHRLGWRHSISLEEGVRETYRWYLENVK